MSDPRNIEDLRQATSLSLALIVHSLVSVMASLGLAFYHSWSLTFVSLAGLPLVIVVGFLTSIPIKKNFRLHKRAHEAALGRAHWAMRSISTVKVLQGESFECDTVNKNLAVSYSTSKKLYTFLNLQEALSRIIMLAMFVQAFYYGSVQVRKGSIRSGDVLVVFWCCLSVAQSFRSLTPQLVFFQKGLAATSRLEDIMDPGEDALSQFKRTIGLYPDQVIGSISFYRVSRILSDRLVIHLTV